MYAWLLLVAAALAVVSAVFRLDWAARSLARRHARKVGIAMASRMARMSSTT